MYTKNNVSVMSNEDLLNSYRSLKQLDKERFEHCVKNGFYDKFNYSEYIRLRNETSVLKMEIELMKRRLI